MANSDGRTDTNGHRLKTRPNQSTKERADETKVPSRNLSRMTVNINAATEDALRELSELEGVTLTEALRRLVGYGQLVYNTIREDGGEVLIKKEGDLRSVHLI